MTLARNFSWLHRRRLHRRLRSRQYADPLRPAHGADHRRALGRSGAARGRCGGGVAEEPLDRGRPCGDALARRGKMAARPRRASCAVQDLLDLQFHRRRQYRPGDGCAARRFRRCDRAGDAGVSGDRPHRLSGQSVRRLGAAERKPAEGSSAQSDARFQSGAGAGAPEQDQDRAGRSRRHRARAGCGPRASGRARQARALAPPSSMRCSTRDLETIGTVALDHRVSVGASGIGLGLARALVASGRVKSNAPSAISEAPVGGPAACLAGSCSQATLQQIANAEQVDAGAASRSRAGRRGQGRSPARAGLGQGAARRRARS